MTYASFPQRLSGAIIDGAIFVLFLGILTGNSQHGTTLAALYTIAAIVLALIISIILSVRYSGTPGKLLLNCQIVDEPSGEPISLKQGMRRSLGYFATLATFGVGFIWILIDKKNQAMHDKIAETVVVFNGTVDLFDESQKSLEQLISEVR